MKNENLTMKFCYSMNLFGCLNRESVDSNTEVLKAAIVYRTENVDGFGIQDCIDIYQTPTTGIW